MEEEDPAGCPRLGIGNCWTEEEEDEADGAVPPWGGHSEVLKNLIDEGGGSTAALPSSTGGRAPAEGQAYPETGDALDAEGCCALLKVDVLGAYGEGVSWYGC